MAFAAAGVAGRAAAGRAAGGAAARGAASQGAARSAASKGASKGSGSAFGTAARAKGDPELAAQLAELNGDTPPAKAPAPAPEPTAEPEPPAKPSNPGSPLTGVKAGARKLSTSSEGTPGFYRRAERYSSPTVVANAGGGALLGLVAYMVGLTYLRDGRAGVVALYRAKFLNQTSARVAGSSS